MDLKLTEDQYKILLNSLYIAQYYLKNKIDKKQIVDVQYVVADGKYQQVNELIDSIVIQK
jgi:hypothetical protein